MVRWILLLSIVVFAGCEKKPAADAPATGQTTSVARTETATQTTSVAKTEAPAVPTKVDGAKAKELVKSGALLLDVRTQSEFDGGHIEGATLIPIQELDGRLAEVGPKDKPVVVYCASGMRSGRAAATLAKSGWGKVYDLGAMSNW